MILILQKYGNHRAEYLVLSSITQTVSRVCCDRLLRKKYESEALVYKNWCSCRAAHMRIVTGAFDTRRTYVARGCRVDGMLWNRGVWRGGYKATLAIVPGRVPRSIRSQGRVRTDDARRRRRRDAQAHANLKKHEQYAQHRCFCC